MLAPTFRAFRKRSLLRCDKLLWKHMCKILFWLIPIFCDIMIFIFLANFRNKLLFCRLTLLWGEINLIRRFSLVSSPGLQFPWTPGTQNMTKWIFCWKVFFFTHTNKVNVPTGPLVLFFFPTFFPRSNPSGHSIVMTSSTKPRGLITLSWEKKH